MRWDRDLGIWSLFRTRWLAVSGTTPRNADSWALHLDSDGLDRNLSASSDWSVRHFEIGYWKGQRHYTLLEIGGHRLHRKYHGVYGGMCRCANTERKG